MEHKSKPTSRSLQNQAPGSYRADKLMVLETGIQPGVADESLPERYGMPLLELLVVDPFYVFVSWEITEHQLDELKSSWGHELFEQRRLVVRFMEAESSRFIHSQELYGEIGRWFIALGESDRWIKAELNFVSDLRMFTIATAGPIFIPRLRPVEPDEFVEMSVLYTTGENGQLILLDKGISGKEIPCGLRLPAVELYIDRSEGEDPARFSGLNMAGHSWPFAPGSDYGVDVTGNTPPCDKRGMNDD